MHVKHLINAGGNTLKYETFMVVGGAGFVGSHIVDQLVEQGAKKVVVMDNLFSWQCK